MPLTLGAQVGSYEVLSHLGAGGMGEVYLARDGKLDRQVAIKVLPPDVVRDPERIARFEREAKVLASLNHPNIAGVYGFDESEGARFLVMEYVEGETLSAILKRGAMAIDDALDIARQMAEGLEEAHERGIVHRDLKPGNVMITPEGKVKILDFGLAKAMTDDSSVVSDANSPTITANFTRPGVILGTAAYMSPEQARGRAVDKRSDIWSFGVVLYEMLTGDSPFRGDTVTDSVGAILHKELDFDALPDALGAACRRVLTRCLERDRTTRLRDIGDARIELSCSSKDDAPLAEPSGRGRSSGALLAVVLTLGAVVGGLLGLELGRGPTGEAAYVSLQAPNKTRIRFAGDLAGPPVVSPDGTKIAFAAAREGEPQRLWVRQLGDVRPKELAGTDDATFPFWSPDSAHLGYFTNKQLRRIDLVTGTNMVVCPAAEARGATWTKDGRIIFAPAFRSALQIVDENGGRPSPLTELDEERHTTHRWPSTLPGGDRFLFFSAHRARTLRFEHQGIYIGYFDERPPRLLLRSAYAGAFVSDHLLFVRDGVLLASRVDFENAALVGDLKVLARDVAADPSTWHPQFSASAAGVLAFSATPKFDNDKERSVQDIGSFEFEGDAVRHLTGEGLPATTYADGVPHGDMALSTDGRSLMLSVPASDGTLDLWIYPTTWVPDPTDAAAAAARSFAALAPTPQRFTFLEGSEAYAAWSPDSSEVAFSRLDVKTNAPGIYRQRIGGGSAELVLDAQDAPAFPTHWTRDGKYLIATRGSWEATELNDIWAVPLDGGEPIPLVTSPKLDADGSVSPDGRWLAYTSRTSSQNEVFVIPFGPNWETDPGQRRWQVSVDGGALPKWSADGKRLYYVTRSGMLMSVDVLAAEGTFAYSTAEDLFQTPWEIGSSYGVFPPRVDGGTHFTFTATRAPANSPISLILNWPALLDE